MASADGRVLGPPVKILDNGPDAQRFNIVIAGDGFVADPMAPDPLKDFTDFCTAFVVHLTGRPWYPVIGRVINVHRLPVASNEAGTDVPPPCPGSPVSVNTYFDGTVKCESSAGGWVEVDWNWTWQVFNQHFPGYGFGVVAVNTTSGGGYAVSNIAAVGARSNGSHDVLLHEMGHAMAPLGDHYILEPSTAPAGQEPPFANLTAQTDLARVKWRHWFAVQPGDPPVMKNPDCTRFDARPNPFGDDHLVGLFESSYYFCGWFRPTYQCRMRNAPTEFCPVCLEEMHAALSTYASPVQTFDLVVPGGGSTLEFGSVPAGSTVTRSFEVRNVRSPGAWPSALSVTVSIDGAQFAFAPGTEVTFKIPAPIEQTTYSRSVEVSFTAPADGTQEFTGQVTVSVQGATAPATLSLHATAVRSTVDVGVLVIDPRHRSAYVNAFVRRDFVSAMKAVFQIRHVLGAIDFPHDSGVPTSPSALDAVKARFFADFPLTGYATYAAYFSLAGDPSAGSAAARDARLATVRRVTWTFPGGGGSITNGSVEVGPEVMEVARQNGVTNSALIVVEPSPMTVSVAVLALDPQQDDAYLTAVQRQDYVGAMRAVLRVRRMLGQVDFAHDSDVPTLPTHIPGVRSRFLTEFPGPTKTLVTYFSRVGQVGSGSVAIRDSRRELVRTATWTGTSGGVGSLANASFEVGPDVFELAAQHGFPYDAIMVVHPFPE